MARPTRLCSIDGCDYKHEARGFCGGHYRRYIAHGDEMDKGTINRHSGANKNLEFCLTDGCTRKPSVRGYCNAHNRRIEVTGTDSPNIPLGKKNPETCTVEECSGKTAAKGLCAAHYGRLRKYGSVLASVPISVLRKEPNATSVCLDKELGDCSSDEIHCRGRCRLHYMRLWRKENAEEKMS